MRKQFNRGLAPNHTNLVGLRVETSLSLLCSVGRSQSNNNKVYSSKDSKNSTIKQSLMQKTENCEDSGGSALGDTLNKALQISLDEYYFLYCRIVRTCCSLLKLSYFSFLACGTWYVESGTWCVCTTNVEIEL